METAMADLVSQMSSWAATFLSDYAPMFAVAIGIPMVGAIVGLIASIFRS